MIIPLCTHDARLIGHKKWVIAPYRFPLLVPGQQKSETVWFQAEIFRPEPGAAYRTVHRAMQELTEYEERVLVGQYGESLPKTEDADDRAQETEEEN